ncbi:MAG: S-layer homology domain-containing protein [Oscillospiraceae bacterium]|nr:S-layer homology domain-containing protein [Oscillospiraceae bacterium]
MKIRLTRRIFALVMAFVMVVGLLPAMASAAQAADDSSRDIPLSEVVVSCGDYEPDGGATEGPASLAVDNNTGTMWHTDWYGTSNENHWFQFELTEEYAVDGLRYLPRQTGNENGTITQYEVQVSDDGVTFRTVASGSWAQSRDWKIAEFGAEVVKYVRLQSKAAYCENTSVVCASAAEIRLTGDPAVVGEVDKTALDALIAECELIEQGNYTNKTWVAFQNALESARAVSANDYASQTKVDEALAALLAAREGLKEKTGDGIQKIFHLDSGRKFYSKDWTIALLNELSAAGYTHLQLAFGNNGFRFLLDDMTIDCDGTIYDSDDVKAGIKLGNANYYDEGEKHALTESEMDEIIAHANSIGIQIIPHLNMPGHMSALLDAMDYVGVAYPHFTGYVVSDSSVNLNNQAALDFMMVLVDKYAAYFAEKGCKYFHIGADEYANDAYNGNMGFPNMGSTLYQKFADFVNTNAQIVKDYGMTPRAWNDGISYGSYTAQFDSDIEINYWSSGWWGYDLAKASKLDTNGHGLINTNGDYYYILGKNDCFTTGSSTVHDPNLYTECAGFDITRFMDGSIIEEPVGGMFCVWADYPGAETEQQVAANIRLVLRAMALRMDDLPLDGMNTAVVPGGFNEDGSINVAEPPHEHTPGEAVRENNVDPTCTTEGSYDSVIRCAECGEVISRETVIVPVIAHTEEVIPAVAPTCSETGLTEGKKCSVCGEILEAQEVVEKLAHTEEIIPGKDATCTETGLTEGKKCSVCGEILVAQKVVPVLGHDWQDGECSRCEATLENPFVDVPNDSYYVDAVLWAVKEGVTAGTSNTTFSPLKVVTRAEAVTFLWSAAGKPEPVTGINPFVDVAETDFYYKAVLWAYEKGITSGVDAEHFAPAMECSRAHAVTFLYRAVGQPAIENRVNHFEDVAYEAYYLNAVLWAVENGVTAGVSATEFGPGVLCNRAQIVTFLYKTYNK